jgi:hypothetical protein
MDLARRAELTAQPHGSTHTASDGGPEWSALPSQHCRGTASWDTALVGKHDGSQWVVGRFPVTRKASTHDTRGILPRHGDNTGG